MGFGSISVGVWLAMGYGVTRGGLRGGSRWVCGVARNGGSHFRFWVWFFVFVFLFLTLLQTHSVEYFVVHFPKM